MQLLPVPDLAEVLGIGVNRAHQLLRDGQLVAVRDEAGHKAVPADFVQDGAVLKGLPAVITLLRDARYADEEIVEWLNRPDDSLPGTPLEALRANRGSEIKRRAQVAGF